MAKAMENRETSEAPRPERGTRTVREGPKPHGGRARSGGVGPRHTIDEPTEQRRGIFGGGWGEKGAGQGEHCLIPHRPDTVRGARVPGIQQCGRVTTFLAPSPRWEPYALTRSYGSVRGAISDGRPYRDRVLASFGTQLDAKTTL